MMAGTVPEARKEPQLLTYNIDDVKIMLGISRGHAYAMAREGAFPCLILGRRVVCPRDRFDAWLAGEHQAAS